MLDGFCGWLCWPVVWYAVNNHIVKSFYNDCSLLMFCSSSQISVQGLQDGSSTESDGVPPIPPCPPCSTEAGCPQTVCACEFGSLRMNPPPHSLKSTQLGCPDCEKGTNCMAYRIRMACNHLSQCTEWQSQTWLSEPL